MGTLIPRKHNEGGANVEMARQAYLCGELCAATPENHQRHKIAVL